MAVVSKSFMHQRSKVLKKGLVKTRSSDDFSKNLYLLPLPKYKITAFGSSDVSPAHAGNLSNSIDLFVPEGTEVYAAADGTVVNAKDSFRSGGTAVSYWSRGNYIDIRHANKEYTWYEHLRFKGVTVRKGSKVKAGQLIGYSGNTGFSELPHLHFQVNRYFGRGPEDYVTLKARFANFVDVYRII